jgi:trimethylamine--corrinoid protein Co-methyltransferase
MLETMWSTFPAMNAHANFLQHATGWLEGGLTVNKEKIMIDIENLAMLQKYLEPVQINGDTLALEYIAKVGAGGHHFETAHTQARYSTEYYSPILGDRQNHGDMGEGRGARYGGACQQSL